MLGRSNHTHHPSLDAALRETDVATAARLGLSLYARCGCGRSGSAHLEMVVRDRPSVRRMTVIALAERLTCNKCGEPFANVSLSDAACGPDCPGVYPRTWGILLVDRAAG
ncbi:hypothetical protein J2D73_16755 [Acetobacter sacchari]|uniref:Hydrogenase nickel incorporation protein HypA n=1 Tax=Acetobacter sacchari TaxID=2661687 RepID=A0ABS3LZX0_9PROT|nr:hypothetical protein [Acetobacter sacchari]MBO1361437.1 hypothetical protein [Acetobacter sacchari]